MTYYFKLQFKILNRRIYDFGIPPLIGYIIILFFFLLVSNYLLINIQYGEYLYTILSLFFLSRLSNITKSRFLKNLYLRFDYYKLRVIENTLVAIPFMTILILQKQYILAIILFFVNFLLAVFSFKRQLNTILPTPFYKYPFEFILGFRKSFSLIILAYFLTFMSLKVWNFNLGIFALLLIFLNCISFYSYPEPKFYVWIHSQTPKEFLKNKIKISILYSALISLPIAILLGISFFENILIIIVFQCLGFFYLTTGLLGKYAAYPSKINLKQTIGLMISFWFPPLLILITPYFYKESIKNLNEILE